MQFDYIKYMNYISPVTVTVLKNDQTKSFEQQSSINSFPHDPGLLLIV